MSPTRDWNLLDDIREHFCRHVAIRRCKRADARGYSRCAEGKRPAWRYINANLQQVGELASDIEVATLIDLTVRLKLSYQQLRSLLLLLAMLFLR